MGRRNRKVVKEKKSEIPAFSIKNAGTIGQEIFEDIVKGVGGLVPVSGRIYLEIDLEIEDDDLFGDDELRRSKLIVEVALEKPEIIMEKPDVMVIGEG